MGTFMYSAGPDGSGSTGENARKGGFREMWEEGGHTEVLMGKMICGEWGRKYPSQKGAVGNKMWIDPWYGSTWRQAWSRSVFFMGKALGEEEKFDSSQYILPVSSHGHPTGSYCQRACTSLANSESVRDSSVPSAMHAPILPCASWQRQKWWGNYSPPTVPSYYL